MKENFRKFSFAGSPICSSTSEATALRPDLINSKTKFFHFSYPSVTNKFESYQLKFEINRFFKFSSSSPTLSYLPLLCKFFIFT